MYNISIIIPIIDEFDSLKKTYNIVNSIGRDKKEFLVIMSKKKTPKIIKKKLNKLSSKLNNLKIYCQKAPFVGGAIKTGIKKASKSHIVIMASDMETNPYDLKKMILLSKKNPNKIICADRWKKGGKIHKYGKLKKLMNFIFQKTLSFILKVNLSDFTFAYRIYPKNALKKFKFKENRFSFALEMLLKPMKHGYKILSTPATWSPRTEGKSQITFLDYLHYFKVLYRIK